MKFLSQPNAGKAGNSSDSNISQCIYFACNYILAYARPIPNKKCDKGAPLTD